MLRLTNLILKMPETGSACAIRSQVVRERRGGGRRVRAPLRADCSISKRATKKTQTRRRQACNAGALLFDCAYFARGGGWRNAREDDERDWGVAASGRGVRQTQSKSTQARHTQALLRLSRRDERGGERERTLRHISVSPLEITTRRVCVLVPTPGDGGGGRDGAHSARRGRRGRGFAGRRGGRGL